MGSVQSSCLPNGTAKVYKAGICKPTAMLFTSQSNTVFPQQLKLRKGSGTHKLKQNIDSCIEFRGTPRNLKAKSLFSRNFWGEKKTNIRVLWNTVIFDRK